MINAVDYYVKHGEKTYKDLLDIDLDICYHYIDYINVTVLDDGIIKLLSGDPKEFRFIRKDGKDSE